MMRRFASKKLRRFAAVTGNTSTSPHGTGMTQSLKSFLLTLCAEVVRNRRINSQRSDKRDNRFPVNVVEYSDASTWKSDWTAHDIKHLLHKHLLNPATAPNYNSLSVLLSEGHIEAIQHLLRECVKIPKNPKEMSTAEYIDESLKYDSLKNSSRTSSLPNIDSTLDLIESGLSPRPGCSERNLVLYDSPLQWVTMHIVKRFLSERRANALRNGLVIVCCGNTLPQKEFIYRLFEAYLTNSKGCSTQDAVCELIRTHVEYVTHCPQDPSNYGNPLVAYATWKRETARHFNIPGKMDEPLIVLVEKCVQFSHSLSTQHSFINRQENRTQCWRHSALRSRRHRAF
ncbi:Bodo-specific multi-copy gene family, putative [Bodo saltans]|uniref:Bodo-specific multi-copy gene family, putative n=1 Tax=Bodo saltans TaxID=75058 RepID=A0A0S4JRF0_BODSA|nr:Bodo-specific multi-copy gene family, putative [Bodo saltans]|eukprot:CUG92558.1 Bodo-specific multi-copy gene family, putative [Bodo saltans]